MAARKKNEKINYCILFFGFQLMKTLKTIRI